MCFLNYGKCPKISYTKLSDKMAYANSVDPDQPGSILFAIPLGILGNNCIKKTTTTTKSGPKRYGIVFKILGHIL